MNNKFDLSEWMGKIPWENCNFNEFDHWYYAPNITGPLDVCAIEYLRALVKNQYDWGIGIPMDIFIWGKGNTENRTETRIGGIPYKPKYQTWPTDSNGVNLPFIGQFNFTDSKDIVEISGDILLIFGIIYQDELKSIHLEWQNIDDFDLVSDAEIPDVYWKPDPFHGYILRTVSYPDATLKTDNRYPIILGKEIRSEERITTYDATCIGRCPLLDPPLKKDTTSFPLCVLSSLGISIYEQEFPWVNIREPATLKEELDKMNNWNGFYPLPQFMFGDGGALHIRSLSDGTLTASISTF